MDTQKLLNDMFNLNVKNAVIIKVEDIQFSDEVRKYCEMNSCGKYAKNWACPPGVGAISELKANAQEYNRGVLLQTVHQINNSFDYKGMMAAKKSHEEILRSALQILREDHYLDQTLLLGAGSCEVCKECTYVSGQPCRHPEQAMASLEAYGIDVISLVKQHDIPFYHGKNTVSYVGLILFK